MHKFIGVIYVRYMFIFMKRSLFLLSLVKQFQNSFRHRGKGNVWPILNIKPTPESHMKIYDVSSTWFKCFGNPRSLKLRMHQSWRPGQLRSSLGIEMFPARRVPPCTPYTRKVCLYSCTMLCVSRYVFSVVIPLFLCICTIGSINVDTINVPKAKTQISSRAQ